MSAPQPPESALARIVAELRAARVARGLSLQELSRLLKIQEHYLADIEDGNFSFLSCAYVYAYIKEYAREMGVGDTARLQACRRELGVLVGVKETGITDYIQSLSPAGMFRNSSLYGFLQGLRKKSVVLVLTVLAAIFVLAAGAVSLSSGSGGGDFLQLLPLIPLMQWLWLIQLLQSALLLKPPGGREQSEGASAKAVSLCCWFLKGG